MTYILRMHGVARYHTDDFVSPTSPEVHDVLIRLIAVFFSMGSYLHDVGAIRLDIHRLRSRKVYCLRCKRMEAHRSASGLPPQLDLLYSEPDVKLDNGKSASGPKSILHAILVFPAFRHNARFGAPAILCSLWHRSGALGTWIFFLELKLY